jgi:hypothetical protein
MTSRPGVVKEIVAVDLPRPRDMTWLSTDTAAISRG